MTTYTDIELMEGAAYTWRFSLRDEHDAVLPLDNFLIYGGAACPGQVTRDFVVTIEDGEAVAVMPGLPATRTAWQYQLFAQEKSSRVEWLISAGSAIITPRTSGAREVYDPTLNTFIAVLDKSTISHTLKVGDNMASISRNTAIAIQRATEATTAAHTATERATAASASANTATQQAGIATTAAGTATAQATAASASANTATQQAGIATTAAGTATAQATAASTSANTATQQAGTATTAAGTATAQATAASASANTATQQAGIATTAAGTATTQAGIATEQATAAERSAQQARQSAIDVGTDQAERARAAANEAEASAVAAEESVRRIVALTSGTFYTQDDFVPADRYISDAGMDFILTTLAEPYGHVSEVYGVEFPAWPDLSNSTTGPTVSVAGVAYGQHLPWAQQKATNPETFIHKIRDNAGLIGHFHRQGLDNGDERDDYENRPFFHDYRVNYVIDANGDKRVTAFEGSPQFALTGDVDVGILCRSYWVKVERTVSTDEQRYPRDRYATLYDRFEGVPVWRICVSLVKPADEEGWEPAAAAVRHDGTMAPYIVRSPYLAGWKNGKLRNQPGLQAINNVSYSTLYGYYENPNSSAYKGPGYHGGSFEVAAWGWLNAMLKYGVKSSQSLAIGINIIAQIYPAVPPPSEPTNVVTVSSGDAATLQPGLRVALRRTYAASNTATYDVVTHYGGSTENWDSASRYVTARTGARILSSVKREDGRYDLTLDCAPLNLADTEMQRWAFADSVSGEPFSEYLEYDSAQASNPARAFYRTIDLKDGRGSVKHYVKWVENPDFDAETGTEGSYFPIYGTWNTYRYAINLKSVAAATWNRYQYVPELVQHTARNRVYIQQAFPCSGMTDAILKHKDGVIGYPTRAWSPYRLRMIEYGAGLLECVTDAVGLSYTVDEAVRSFTYIAPKGGQGTRKNDFSSMRANYVNVGVKPSANSWPPEYRFILGSRNYGTDTIPKYIDGGMPPDGSVTYTSPSGSDGGAAGYGDFNTTANTNNTAYEFLTGCSVYPNGLLGPGANGGLLFLLSYYGLGHSNWCISARD